MVSLIPGDLNFDGRQIFCRLVVDQRVIEGYPSVPITEAELRFLWIVQAGRSMVAEPFVMKIIDAAVLNHAKQDPV